MEIIYILISCYILVFWLLYSYNYNMYAFNAENYTKAVITTNTIILLAALSIIPGLQLGVLIYVVESNKSVIWYYDY